MFYLFRELSSPSICCVTNSKCPPLSAEADTSMATSSTAGSPCRQDNSSHVPATHTHTNTRSDRAHVQQQVMWAHLLGMEDLVRPLTELRSQVFIHPHPLHTSGGLVVLPGH